MENKKGMGHIAALITIFIWGTTFISTKFLLNTFKPIEILFFRFVIGLIVLILIYPKQLKDTTKKQEMTFAAAGLCGITLYYLLENIALTYTMASNVGVIISVAPFFTAILSYIASNKNNKLSLNFFIGFVIAIIGICLISFSNSKIEIKPIGDILAFIAALVWAVYSLLTKKISSFGFNTVQTTQRIFTYGIILMIPALFFVDFRLDFKNLMNISNMLNLIFLGLGASALCFVTWNFAVKYLGAVNTSIYIYIVPVITVASSTILLKEQITVLSIIGTLLTLSGLLISEIKFNFKKREKH